MVFMVPDGNVTWPNSQRFSNMRVKLLELISETITEDSTEYITTAGGWLRIWRHIDHLRPCEHKHVGFAT